VTKKGK